MRLWGVIIKIPNRPILWTVTAIHYGWGFALVLLPDQVRLTTGLAPFRAEPEAFGLVFLASATVATLALIHEATNHKVNRLTFWAFIPQQILLFITAFSVIFYITQGHYASGTDLPRWFIAMDQLPKLVLAAFHPFGILRMHVPILPRRVVDGNE